MTTHAFSIAKTYAVSLTVNDGNGGTDTATELITINTGNNPPVKPTISGPLTGHKNTEYSYTMSSTDADDDAIQYLIDWGDDQQQITDFFNSGAVTSQTHTWTAPGKYDIEIYASDNQTTSGTTQYTVNIDTKEVEQQPHSPTDKEC